jgi:predicted outer membrane repeat protein
MINGLPAILVLGSHAVIADGYNTIGYFHLNFGFGSSNPDSITDIWYKLNDNWKDSYNGLKGGVLDIKSRPLKWNLQLKSKEIIRLRGECVNVPSERVLFYIVNSGLWPIFIDHIITSTNFHYELPQAPYFPNEHIILDPNDSTSVLIWYIPDSLGTIYGKLQIFASYQNEYYNENKYIDMDLLGRGLAGTVIWEGTVSGIWNKESSPYFIRGNISVTEGEELIIEAGTEIVFEGPYEFNIEQGAQLIAKGAENDSIYFTSSKTHIKWQGFVFKNSGYDDTLAYCVISHVNRMGSTLSRGGGISLIGSSPIIEHARVAKNRSFNSGGGMYLQNSHAFITNTRLEQNKCSMNGGGIFLTAGSSPKIMNVDIIDNLAEGNGGGIFCSDSDIDLSNVTIGNNSAEDHGGGIYCNGDSYLNFDSKNRCNIYLNNADSAGTDLYNASSHSINVVLDMFTALEPTDSLAYPLEKFTFDILKMPRDINVAAEFVLSQNYPNPFNPSTKIIFTLPKSKNVTIEVYNIIGQKIKTLLNKQMPAGSHKIKFNGQNLSSGVYLYRIKAGAWQDVKKMLLVK